jgi:hypothetical protein
MRDFNWPQTPCTVFIDPAGQNRTEMSPMSAFNFLKSKGLNVVIPELVNNDVMVRITAVDALLRQIYKGENGEPMPMFLMSRKCKTLREAMNGGYCYRKKRAADGSARYDEKPDKESKFSHVADGLQYVVVGSTGWKGARFPWSAAWAGSADSSGRRRTHTSSSADAISAARSGKFFPQRVAMGSPVIMWAWTFRWNRFSARR